MTIDSSLEDLYADNSYRSDCGVVIAHSLDNALDMMGAIQNRGRHSAGIAALRKDRKIVVVKWNGPVETFDRKNLGRVLYADHAELFIGHVRYATNDIRGDVRGAHPHFIPHRKTALTNHGSHLIARDVLGAVAYNGHLVSCPGRYTETLEDPEFPDDPGRSRTVLNDSLYLLDTYMRGGRKGQEKVLRTIPGAYSAVFLISGLDGAVALRDKFGIRPLYQGRDKSGRLIVASETNALDIVGERERSVPPGSALIIRGSQFEMHQVIDGDDLPRRAGCFFEVPYLQNDASVIDGSGVGDMRYRLGERLYEEFLESGVIKPSEVDGVLYVPSCPEQAAKGFYERLKGETGRDLIVNPYDNGLYKIKGERAFMGKDPKSRAESIRHNLFLSDRIAGHIKGTVLIIDDSQVRGNNIVPANRYVREAGAARVYDLFCTPPIGPSVDDEYGDRGCEFGVDMPPNDDFIYRRNGGSCERIARETGADYVFYLSTEGMHRATGGDKDELCTFCIGGPHPMHGYV